MRQRRSTKLLAVIAGISLIAAACGDDDDAGGTEPGATTPPGDTGSDGTETPGNEPGGVEGGELVMVHEQEPQDLHLDDPENNLAITAWIHQGTIEGLWGNASDLTYVPELLADDGEVVENDDGSVTVNLTLRDGLTWSDGEPFTAEEVKANWEAFEAKDGDEYIYLLSDHTGYDTITDFTVSSETEFSITWSEFFAGYRDLFTRIFPMHVFSDDPATAAAEMNEHLRDWTTPDGDVLPASGPFVYESRQQGVGMTLRRNDQYHGSTHPEVQNQGAPAYVDTLQIQFVTDTDSAINALKAGEAHFIWSQPQLEFEELNSDENFEIASEGGPTYEHWSLNVHNTHLAKPEVREALALAMDKASVMENLYTPLFGDALPDEGLGNVFWMSNQPQYVDHAGEAGYGQGNIDAAKEKLESAGYELDGDVYSHPEDGPLTLRVGTTGGNRLREREEELIQETLKPAGIDISIENIEGSDFFNETINHEQSIECVTSGGESGNCARWDIGQFAWVGGLWPGGASAQFRAREDSNPYGYESDDFDTRSAECDTTIDDEKRDACYNELNTYLTTLEADPNGLVILPITQKPTFYAWNKSALAQGTVATDTNTAGPLATAVDFKLAG